MNISAMFQLHAPMASEEKIFFYFFFFIYLFILFFFFIYLFIFFFFLFICFLCVWQIKPFGCHGNQSNLAVWTRFIWLVENCSRYISVKRLSKYLQ